MDYNSNSIKSLDYFEHIRKYPGMYIGSKDIKGLHHCLKEVISNSIDEYLNNSCSEITITLHEDGAASVKDNGRGIPHGKHPNGMSLLSACFGIANTGGKFNNSTGQTGYNTSGGEHGTGGKAVNALSTKLICSTARDGIKEISTFSKGKLLEEKQEKTKENGVFVKFYPDAEVFETTEFNVTALKTMIKEFSFLCKNLTFNFINEKNSADNDTFYSEKGLYDYLDYLKKDKEYITKPFYFEQQDGTFSIEVAFGYTSSYSNVVKLYTNNIPQEKGTHLTGFKTALTSSLNQFAREKKWLKEKDENLTGSDFEEGQLLIINFKMIDPVFKGQNKEELSSSEGRTYTQKFTSQALKTLFAAREKDIKVIVDKALLARKARDAAKKARETARNGAKKQKKALKFASKLADCSSTDRMKCEIYVTEGDSASGNLKTARDNEFQAVMPVRGKILNTQKATLEQIQKNSEIMTMIEAFGLTIDIKTMKITYKPEDLRYGKIIIMSDADVKQYGV